MSERIQVVSPPSKPVMIFDGDCNFCRRWISRWRQSTGDRVEYVPFQDAIVDERFPELSRERCTQSVQLIETDGRVYDGAEAVFRARHNRPLLWVYRHVPGVAGATEWFYRFVAKHRTAFSALTRFFWGQHVEQPTHFLTRWVFLRTLGLIYLCAFVSLWTQVDGLVGSNGIMPAARFMEAVRTWSLDHNGWAAYWLSPTLCWFSASDTFLHFLCAGGALLSVLVIFGGATAPALMLLWVFYLSLSVVCDVFLGYQWDALLLETGFLAIFFAPLQLRPRLSRESPPSRIMLWLLRWLLFRLMFSSGVVKLASGDPAWHRLTALQVHYETQPLPTWIGWYAHQLPAWFQTFSCAVMFGIELGAPFLIFFPRRLRFVGCAALLFLQFLIMVTGNYCFFNWLTIALCVLLLDDAALRRILPDRLRGPSVPRRSPWLRWRAWLIAPVAAAILLVTIVQQFRVCRVRMRWPAPVFRAYMHTFQSIAPFRSVNTYGLFAVMTTSRAEIVIEGSNDGLTWLPYEFKYKPGDLTRRPRFVAPHQPRADWQMWFAALGNYQNNPWFINFCVRLLQGQPEVLALLDTNPFPGTPPRYIRAMMYDYHFTDFATRRATGTWWRRELRGLYCPVLSLRESQTQ